VHALSVEELAAWERDADESGGEGVRLRPALVVNI
jgi:hypothetical protein